MPARPAVASARLLAVTAGAEPMDQEEQEKEEKKKESLDPDLVQLEQALVSLLQVP